MGVHGIYLRNTAYMSMGVVYQSPRASSSTVIKWLEADGIIFMCWLPMWRI